MAETPSDKPGFFSRLFGRKAEAPKPETPQAGGHPETMPSPPATGADDLAAAPSTVTQASPDTPDERKLPAELAGADLQPVEGIDPEGGGPREPIPRATPEPVGSDGSASARACDARRTRFARGSRSRHAGSASGPCSTSAHRARSTPRCRSAGSGRAHLLPRKSGAGGSGSRRG
jgi:hypothetical protein